MPMITKLVDQKPNFTTADTELLRDYLSDMDVAYVSIPDAVDLINRIENAEENSDWEAKAYDEGMHYMGDACYDYVSDYIHDDCVEAYSDQALRWWEDELDELRAILEEDMDRSDVNRCSEIVERMISCI